MFPPKHCQNKAKTVKGRGQSEDGKLKVEGYIGGHFVLGHVDAAVRIHSKSQRSGSMILVIKIDDGISAL